MPTYECPICQKHITVTAKEEAPYRPFCSERCKMVDLGRWFDGTYRVTESPDADGVAENDKPDG